MMRLALIATGAVAACMCALLAAGGLFAGWMGAPSAADNREVVVVVPPNTQPDALAQLLHREGIVTRPWWFSVYVEHFRRDETSEIHPGEYALATVMSPVEIMSRIHDQAVVTYTVTIPAGWRIDRTIGHLVEVELGAESELGAASRDAELIRSAGVPSKTMEGYLFPDAYDLPKGLSARELLSRLLARYRKSVTDEILADADELGLSEDQLITLASLIELDGVPPGEKAHVASVYHNRLRLGDKLENAAALAYGLRRDVDSLTPEDVEQDHPFNTFVREGLPPHPIASPGLASIVAAARPARTDALYFAPRGDSTHVFCPDYECHRIALERWRQEQARKRRVGLP